MTVVSPQRIRLVDVLPRVHDDLDAEARLRVGRLTLPLLEIPRGRYRPSDHEHPGVAGVAFASVVASGLLVRNVTLSDRVSTHLHGPGDILGLEDPDGGSLPLAIELAALEPTRLMLLDDRFLGVAQRWPRLMSRVLRASASQLARLSDDLAISQLPRVEDRLLGMLWSLADRWGVRRGDDVAVRLAVSHGTLGRLIGARRPTVSLGLRNLTEAGRVRRVGDDWLLPAGSLGDFGSVPVPRLRLELSASAAGRSAR